MIERLQHLSFEERWDFTAWREGLLRMGWNQINTCKQKVDQHGMKACQTFLSNVHWLEKSQQGYIESEEILHAKNNILARYKSGQAWEKAAKRSCRNSTHRTKQNLSEQSYATWYSWFYFTEGGVTLHHLLLLKPLCDTALISQGESWVRPSKKKIKKPFFFCQKETKLEITA